MPPTAAPAAAAAPRQQITVTTDVLRLTFDTEGGSLVRTEFLKQAGDNKTGSLRAAGRQRRAASTWPKSGLIGGDFPNHKTLMTFSGDRELKDGANELV